MNLHERGRVMGQFLLPQHQARYRRDVRRLMAAMQRPDPEILDVGGRRSPYTVGLEARVTVMDMPRESEVQHDLGLGMTDQIEGRLKSQRTNIAAVRLEDMTKCTLPDETFDLVTAVEVIEHVPDDDAFVAQAARVLRPGGWMYMTTPNGDWTPHTVNPDHLRHYSRSHLHNLLAEHFDEVSIVYGIHSGVHRYPNLGAMSLKRPLNTANIVRHAWLNRLESIGMEQSPHHTFTLFAYARKGPLPHPWPGRTSEELEARQQAAEQLKSGKRTKPAP